MTYVMEYVLIYPTYIYIYINILYLRSWAMGIDL